MATAAPRTVLSLSIVSPCVMFFFDHPIGVVRLSIKQGTTHLRDKALAEHAGVTLALALSAHEIEVAAFVGLQNGLVEQMRVTAFGPVRRRDRLHRGTSLFQLGGIDQKIDAAFCDI